MDSNAIQLLKTGQQPNYSRMGIALLLSAVIHALLLLINFVPAKTRPSSSSIAVTLVNSSTKHAPLKPQALAQHNLEGGGSDTGIASTPLPHTDIEQETSILEELRKQQDLLEKEQQRLLTQLESTYSVPAITNSKQAEGDSSQTGTDYYNQQSQLINAQIAAIKEQIQKYNQSPRKTFVAPSTQVVNYAEYVEAWRSQIEAIGTKHYPEQARGKIYGSLQLTVYIQADGHIDHIVFDRPATQAILNSAAQRIIELAEPFQPLPAAIRQETDILAITRTWHFTRHGLATN